MGEIQKKAYANAAGKDKNTRRVNAAYRKMEA
jgi:hypothetical protein